MVGRRWFGLYYFVHPREGSIEDTVQVVCGFVCDRNDSEGTIGTGEREGERDQEDRKVE